MMPYELQDFRVVMRLTFEAVFSTALNVLQSLWTVNAVLVFDMWVGVFKIFLSLYAFFLFIFFNPAHKKYTHLKTPKPALKSPSKNFLNYFNPDHRQS